MVIGVTGPTGAGKSTVCDILRNWTGVSVIDCDQVARQVTEKGTLCLLDIAVEFSPSVISADGTLNRKKLGQLVFSDPEKLTRLNAIIFPYILERLREEIADAEKRGAKAIFLDAPTLFESGADALCEKILAVTSAPEKRLTRIMQRDSLSPQGAADRMASQPDADFYLARADYQIQNDDDTAALRLAVMELQNRLGL